MLVGAALAVLAAVANAVGSVLQRRGSQDRTEGSTIREGARELLRRPGWLAGVGAHVVGFALQGVALGFALISVVQPLLVAELPVTLVLSALVFRTRLRRRAWAAVAVIAAALALFLFALAPRGGHPETVPPPVWVVGVGVNAAVVVVLVVLAVRSTADRRALCFGVATGVTYGLNAALLTGVAVAVRPGWTGVFQAWQTYGVLVGGTVSFLLLQQALQAGDLVAAQPGITLANPLVALVWGFAVFGEDARGGPWPAAAVGAGLALAVATVVLTRAAPPDAVPAGPGAAAGAPSS